MFNPAGDENTNEYIEIYNRSDKTVDLAGWKVSDSAATDLLTGTGSGLILQPGQYALILDPDYLDGGSEYSGRIPPDALILTIDNPTFGSRGLRNSAGELISLLDNASRIVSQIRYSADNVDGISEEKIDPEQPDTANNWGNSSVIGGTPGFHNSISPYKCDLKFIEASLDALPVKGTETALTVIIRNSGLETCSEFSMRLYIDGNGNGFPDETELCQLEEYTKTILPGQEKSVDIPWIPDKDGKFPVILEIFSANEDNPSDNTGLITVQVFECMFPVVISEIMSSPAAGKPEWIEIKNISTAPVSLAGWKMSDASGDEGIILQEVEVLPNGFYILAEFPLQDNLYDDALLRQVQLEGFPRLNNDGDSISMIDFNGFILDSVSYAVSSSRGVSLERMDCSSRTAGLENWGESRSVYGATPGTVNSIDKSRQTESVELKIEPNPFSPGRNGQPDVLQISYSLPFVPGNVKLFIYDRYGRKVRELIGGRKGAPGESIYWDGCSDNGPALPAGLYIVYFETISPSTGKKYCKKETLVIARY